MELEETIEYYHPNVLTGYLSHLMGTSSHKITSREIVILEIVWYFAGINVFMMTFPVFVIVQKIKVPSNHRLSHMGITRIGILSEPLCIRIHLLTIY